MNRTVRTAMVGVALLLLTAAVPAFAGGFFERDGAAIGGYDPIAYFLETKPVKGLREFQAEYQGSTFYFSTAANRDLFVGNPAKYSPQYGGYCAFGMARGYKASIDPFAFTVVGDKLYLNYSEPVRSQWLSDIPGYVQKADVNWPAVKHLVKVYD